jgi:hypothetical protein
MPAAPEAAEAQSGPALVKKCRLHNDAKTKATPLDRALAAQYLREKGYSWREVAEALGEAETAVRHLQAFFVLPPSILELGKAKPQRFLACFAELMKKELPAIGEEKMCSLFACALEEGWSLREFKARIAAEKPQLDKQAKRRARQSIALSFALGDGCRLRMLQMPGRKVKLHFAVDGLGKEASQQLFDRMAALLEEFAEGESDARSLLKKTRLRRTNL